MANKRMEDETISKAIEVYEAICWHMDSEDGAPVVRELMVMLDVGGSATIQEYLNTLRSWGWIDWTPGSARTMRLTRPTETMVIQRKAAKRHVA